MRRLISIWTIVVAVTASLLATDGSPGQEFEWNGSENNAWVSGFPENWTPKGVPGVNPVGAGVHAVIPPGFDPVVLISAIDIGTLTAESPIRWQGLATTHGFVMLQDVTFVNVSQIPRITANAEFTMHGEVIWDEAWFSGSGTYRLSGPMLRSAPPPPAAAR